MTLDLDLRLRAHALADWVADAAARRASSRSTPGIRSLQVQVDGDRPDRRVAARRACAPPRTSCRASTTSRCRAGSCTSRCRGTTPRPARPSTATCARVRDDAPWCPWNIEFIRRVNGLDDVDDVQRIVFDAEYLVLGLGDVYLGAPVAVPVDPAPPARDDEVQPGAHRGRRRTRSASAARTSASTAWKGPGGYQFVGRTVPVWHRFGATAHTDARAAVAAALLRPHPLVSRSSADELLELRARVRTRAGSSSTSTTAPSRRAEHHAFLAEHAADDHAVPRPARARRSRTERDAWERDGEFARAEASQAPRRPPTRARSALPDGAVVVESTLHACVWRVHVERGPVVAPGEVVVTVEAMKMETRDRRSRRRRRAPGSCATPGRS